LASSIPRFLSFLPSVVLTTLLSYFSQMKRETAFSSEMLVQVCITSHLGTLYSLYSRHILKRFEISFQYACVVFRVICSALQVMQLLIHRSLTYNIRPRAIFSVSIHFQPSDNCGVRMKYIAKRHFLTDYIKNLLARVVSQCLFRSGYQCFRTVRCLHLDGDRRKRWVQEKAAVSDCKWKFINILNKLITEWWKYKLL
jgi:hypothetical protein